MTARLHQNVLVVDDDGAILSALSRVLVRAGYDCLTAGNLHDAVRQVRQNGPQLGLVVTDLSLSGESGMTLIHHLHRRHPSVPVVVLTAFGDWDLYAESLGEGVLEFLSKPIQPEAIVAVVERVLGPPKVRKRGGVAGGAGRPV